MLQDAANAHTQVMGALSVASLDLQAGLLSGTGTVLGNVVNTGGVVNPGASPGKLTIQGNYTQGALGELDIEVAGYNQGVNYDLLQMTGNASLDGKLVLNFDDAFTPVVGDTFTILTTGTGNVLGTFNNVWSQGWVLSTAYNAHDVTVTVTEAVPEPETYAMMLAGLALVGWAGKRRLV